MGKVYILVYTRKTGFVCHSSASLCPVSNLCSLEEDGFMNNNSYLAAPVFPPYMAAPLLWGYPPPSVMKVVNQRMYLVSLGLYWIHRGVLKGH